MIVPVLTAQGMVLALGDVNFYLEKVSESLTDVDLKIKCHQVLQEAETVLSDFIQFYEEEMPAPPEKFWNQISESWGKEIKGAAELALSQAFSSARLVDSAHAEGCSYAERLRAKARLLGDNILGLLHELRGLK